MRAVAEDITKGEATRRTLLAAAVERFARDGFRATSVADIARDVGVSPSAPFAYFPTKEALFVAAVDEDAAAVMLEGFGGRTGVGIDQWRDKVMPRLIAAVDRHPLARRVLAGLEPDFTARLLQVPALEQVRAEAAQRIRAEQRAGDIRAGVDPEDLADGLVAIVLSMLMTIVQTGGEVGQLLGPGVAAVVESALAPPI